MASDQRISRVPSPPAFTLHNRPPELPHEEADDDEEQQDPMVTASSELHRTRDALATLCHAVADACTRIDEQTREDRIVRIERMVANQTRGINELIVAVNKLKDTLATMMMSQMEPTQQQQIPSTQARSPTPIVIPDSAPPVGRGNGAATAAAGTSKRIRRGDPRVIFK
jgi:hypothetical protein